MTPFTIPNKNGQIIQPNVGDAIGNIFATYGIDLNANKGRLRLGGNLRKAYDNVDDADFSGYMGAFVKYSDSVIFGVSDKAFIGDPGDPTTGWAEASTSGAEPNSGNTIIDATFFDSLALVSQATNIKSWNGSTWADWWTSTLGQSALTGGYKHLLKVGADGNLYITDFGNKLYKVTPTGSIALTGDGTLDFSATPHIFQCMETTSSRLWIGTRNDMGEAVIIEWDMAPNSISANRIHKVGADAVWCIAIFEDTPIAILSNGKIKYFNGSSFVDYPNARIPLYEAIMDEKTVHHNGWAIIDGLPHFLIRGAYALPSGSAYTENNSNDWSFPSGIYALDPQNGLHCRFPLSIGEASKADYGQLSVKEVGALYAIENVSTKFICSFEYYETPSTIVSTLAYLEKMNTQAGRGWFATAFADDFNEVWETLALVHKKFVSGDKINLFYRTELVDTVNAFGTFVGTNQFNTDADLSAFGDGQTCIIKAGPGAGKWLRIKKIDRSSATVTVITFEQDVDFATDGMQTTIAFTNFKWMATIEDTADFHKQNFPISAKVRKVQALVEIEQAAGSRVELDYVIIS